MQQGYIGGLQDALMIVQWCRMLSVVLTLESGSNPLADSNYFLLLDINRGAMDVHRKGLIHRLDLNPCTMLVSTGYLLV
jgi:hypothetical protein